MLLAAEGGVGGTVRFVVQAAEEWGRGAVAMRDGGLMEQRGADLGRRLIRRAGGLTAPATAR